jgi:hypothetical protein
MNFYPPTIYNNTTTIQQKERSSMPNVFATESPQLTWQQSGLLQKKPMMMEDFIPNNEFLSLMSSSVSSPLKKHVSSSNKKRSMVDETPMPSVVSSMSEPIPTTSWNTTPTRKRNKSIRTNNTSAVIEECHPMDNIIESTATTTTTTTTTKDTNTMIPEYNTNTNNNVLAAMPRRQKLRYEGDHYTPKWVRYTGHLKEGYCDSCNPGKWLQLKNSAYW